MTTSRTQFQARVWVSLSMLLGLALFGAASASDAQPTAITVSYADLDLSRLKDAQRLYMRLQRASAIVCGDFDEINLPMQLAWRRCYKDALGKAVTTVNSPQLQAVHGVRAEPTGG
jgi:UrcA family protein